MKNRGKGPEIFGEGEKKFGGSLSFRRKYVHTDRPPPPGRGEELARFADHHGKRAVSSEGVRSIAAGGGGFRSFRGLVQFEFPAKSKIPSIITFHFRGLPVIFRFPRIISDRARKFPSRPLFFRPRWKIKINFLNLMPFFFSFPLNCKFSGFFFLFPQRIITAESCSRRLKKIF